MSFPTATHIYQPPATPTTIFHENRPRACPHLLSRGSNGLGVNRPTPLEGELGNATHANGGLSLKQETDLLEAYRVAVRWSEGYKRRDAWKGLKGKKKRGSDPPVPRCTICHDTLGRLHSCLQCVFVGCWRDGHIQRHLKEKNHMFAADLSRGMLYCQECKDYVYDVEYEAIRNLELTRLDEYVASARDPQNKRVRFTEYRLNDTETHLIRTSSTLATCTGLRGLRNIGNTCFMNVILQAMIHNPLLRSHYLGDRHNRVLCDIRAKTKKPCMACEMDKLFAEFFSGESKPFGPCSFLFSVWQSADELAGYKQHDAHEFFISVLNQLHSNQSENPNHTYNCRCIVHQTFSGLFQSDVTCLKCGNVTTANDPFLDISLDIRSALKRKKGPSKPGSGSNVAEAAPNSLLDCLDRYTHSEKLGFKDYTCTKCNSPQEATKQLSIKRLPPVLSIQLKRFEHFTGTSKIETNIRFSDELDLEPYTTPRQSKPSISKHTSSSLSPISTKAMSSSASSSTSNSPLALKKYGNSSTMNSGSVVQTSVTSTATTSKSSGYSYVANDHVYDLFAVVNHTGKVDTGHYTAYARYRGQWFRFDDHAVRLAHRGDVLASQAYMLFYVKRNLEYAAGPLPPPPSRDEPRVKTECP